MKKTLKIVGLIILLFLVFSLGFILFNQIDFTKRNIIQVCDWQVINESGCGNSLFLFDEYTQTGFTPITFWDPSEHKVCHGEQFSLVINFEAKVKCDYVFIFSNGFGEILIGSGKNSTKAISYNLFYGWNKLSLGFSSDYLFLKSLSNVKLGALVIEGTYLSKPVEKRYQATYPTFNEFIGINALVDDPLGAMDVANHIREYHETVWHQMGENNFNFSPSFSGFEFEPFYKNFSLAGRSITPVIQHSGKWVTGLDNGEAIPCPKDGITTNPSDYTSHAKLLHEIVKNYKLKNTPIRFIENWNEPDKSWHGKEAYVSPYEYASFSSMDYDGHLDPTLSSIQNGDSTTTLVMAGLTDLRTDYVNALSFWCNNNRRGSFPWGVVNAHVYANDPLIKSGITPEKFNLQQKVSSFVRASKTTAPKTQVWLSEFGYDRRDDSPQHVPNIDGYNAEEVQALLLIRSFLLLSSTGLDKAYQYMLRDTKGKGTYASSGLYKTENNKNVYLPSWYFLKTLKDVMGDYKFTKRINTNNEDLYILEFVNNQRVAYAVWLGTDVKSNISTKLPLNFINKQNLVTYAFSNLGPSQKTSLDYTKDLEFNISDKPILILDTLIEERIAKKLDINSILVTNDNAVLLDENTSIDPLYQPTKGMVSLHELKTTDIILKEPKFISHLSLFDDQGQSEVLIEGVYEGVTKLIFEGKTSLYKKWKSLKVGMTVDKIIITHKTNTSKLGEIVFYTY